jgi:molybdate transport system substrate-binding protein
MLRRASFVFSTLVAVVLGAAAAHAGEARVAVAANFTDAAKEIGQVFEEKTGHTVAFSFGSTGTLYTQISQDAPFDVFLAADQARPEKAEAEGYAVKGSRFIYATGKIVLYSADAGLVTGAETLKAAQFGKIAIANPATAPYGTAAVEAMKTLGVYGALEGKIVQGNNIAQTYQFVATGNAELGFVALSQVAATDKGSRWVVPDDLYPTIAQDAVLLEKGADNEAAKAFVAFLKGPEALEIKTKYGYGAGD